MNQNFNANLLKLNIHPNWKSKYCEKTKAEFSRYSYKDFEIRSFTDKIFSNYGIIVCECKLHYFKNGTLNILISYQQNLNKSSPQIYSKIKTSKISKSRQNLLIQKLINKFIASFCNLKASQIFLIIQQKNSDAKITALKNLYKFFKKIVVDLKRHSRNLFFQKGINILLSCAFNKNSAKLLAEFLAEELKNLKQQNNFLKFVKNALLLLWNSKFSKFKGIKIKIKGKLSGRPRSKSRIIKIANGTPAFCINSTINFAEKTVFTSTGTLGLKIWIHEF